MRHAILSIAAWAGVLQTVAAPAPTVDGAARLIGAASVLGTFTVFVYRLGVWRQDMENTKQNLERRLDRLESEYTEHDE